MISMYFYHFGVDFVLFAGIIFDTGIFRFYLAGEGGKNGVLEGLRAVW
jgi:hypothetical protein